MSDAHESQLIMKLDRRIIPLLALLFFTTNLQTDSVQDLRIELYASQNFNATNKWMLLESGTDGSTFDRYITFYYALGFAIFTIPSTFASKFVHINTWFGLLSSLSGLVCVCTTFASTFIGFAVTQFLSGMLLSGVLSGILAYIPMFYIKEEYGFRLCAILVVGDVAASVFGTIMASLIGTREIGLSLKSWKWIFCLNSFISIISAILIYIYLPSTIQSSEFLTPADRVLGQQRVKDSNDPDAEDPDEQDFSMSAMAAASRTKRSILRKSFTFRWQQVVDWAFDSKFYLFSTSLFFLSFVASTTSSRTPVITASILQLRNPSRAWFTLPSVILSALPKVVAVVAALFLAKHSDTKGERAMHTATPLFIASIGLVSIAGIQDSLYRYIMMLVIEPALYASFPLILTYALDYSHGETMKVCVSSGTVAFSAMGPAMVHMMFPYVDSDNAGQFDDWQIGHYALPNDLAVWLVASVSAFGAAALIIVVWFLNRREEAFSWAREPGLRRLMNDDEETHAWGEFGSDGDLLSDSPLANETFGKKKKPAKKVNCGVLKSELDDIPLKTVSTKVEEEIKPDEDDRVMNAGGKLRASDGDMGVGDDDDDWN